jgi:uncharacterized protein
VTLFADSSAVVTHYAPSEPDVVPVGAIVVVSELARVEVVAALWKQERAGVITASDAQLIVSEFEADWRGEAVDERRYYPVAAATAVLERAAATAATHGLRALDAIQLASALAARDADPECRTFLALDERLRRAAATERFDLLPT